MSASMEEQPESAFLAEFIDGRASLRSRSFGVAFRKLADRWSDELIGAETGVVLARSHPITAEGEDPTRVVNPVYQEAQLHGAPRAASVCLLFTGLSFDHHFSAAVTLSADPENSDAVLIDYDAADRCRSPVQVLAATYVVSLNSGALESADPARIVWQVGPPDQGRLELSAVAPCSLAMAEAGRGATRVQIIAPTQAGTFTHRLRYGWRWTSARALTR